MTALGAKKMRERGNRYNRWFGCKAFTVDGVSYDVKPGPNQGMWRMPGYAISASLFVRRLYKRSAVSREALEAVLAENERAERDKDFGMSVGSHEQHPPANASRNT